METGLRCVCGGLPVGTAVSGLDVAALTAEIKVLAKVDAAVAARRSLVISELKRRRSDAAERLRKEGGMSARDANKASKTADGLEKLSKTRDALEKGEISPGQAEQLASRANNPDRSKNIRDNEDQLLERAKNESTDEFARSMRNDDITESPDGGNSLAQNQRRSRKASMWIDPDTGMHCMFAQWDLVTGAPVDALPLDVPVGGQF